jgi:hypothetical protein
MPLRYSGVVSIFIVIPFGSVFNMMNGFEVSSSTGRFLGEFEEDLEDKSGSLLYVSGIIFEKSLLKYFCLSFGLLSKV